ncbi:hypothetical protein ARMGADRAFT_1075206 [Armillaria gallica]|uniref:Uncharacterized protein n=1 Tax=Armillaria gallica TaxID=47427 RepID=A0A2H3DWB6_ARMGA|nr:hypothetical protein ARMGADRAFT_1075206 [Armillaria gallica]
MVGDEKESRDRSSDRSLHPTTSMRVHAKPRSAPRLDAFNFLAQSFTDFALPMVTAHRSQRQPERDSGVERVDHAIGVLDFTPPKPSKTKISPSNTTTFAVVLTMPPRSNRERAMSNEMSTSYSPVTPSVQQVSQALTNTIPVSLYPLCVFSQEDSEPFPAQSHRSL